MACRIFTPGKVTSVYEKTEYYFYGEKEHNDYHEREGLRALSPPSAT